MLSDPLGQQGGQQVGWLYHIRGTINGQPVVYDGSTVTPLKERFSRHQWRQLIEDPNTRIWRVPVYAEPNVGASNRGTLRSALNEAVRGPEQNQIARTRAQVEEANRTRAPGEPETRILNKQRAAADPETFIRRHNASVGEAVEMLEEPRVNQGRSSGPRAGGGAVAGVFVGMALIDAYKFSLQEQESKYTMAPYVLHDEHGAFTLGFGKKWWLALTYHKMYIDGELNGQTIEIEGSEFRRLRSEAEALWGTTDWKGDFVPGLLRRTLPEVCRNCA